MPKAIFTPSHLVIILFFLIMFPSLFQLFGKLRRDPLFSFSLFLSFCVSMLSASCHCWQIITILQTVFREMASVSECMAVMAYSQGFPLLTTFSMCRLGGSKRD